MSSNTTTNLATCETATTSSPQWTEAENSENISPDCGVEPKNAQKAEESEETTEDEESEKTTEDDGSEETTEDEDEPPRPRKKIKLAESPKMRSDAKYKPRQYLVKKRGMKAPLTPIIPSKCLYYEGTMFRIGDVVAIMDVDEDIFYAQIVALLIDQYCDRCAVIQWLLPTTSSPNPNEGFDPETYYLGPKENITRNLMYMQVVMNIPLGYFKTNTVAYPCEKFSYSRRG